MGYPSSVIVQMVVEDFRRNNNTIIPHIGCIVFYGRYVDDLFIITLKTTTDEILTGLNNYHRKLNFTVEKEQNNQTNFLNMTLI